MRGSRYETVDEYIGAFSGEVRSRLEEMRRFIRELAPEASEKISYNIPTFYLNGNLVHYAGYARHIGFYPGARGVSNFAEEISAYKSGRGSVRFPLDKPLPLDLVRKIVLFRVRENFNKKK